MSLELKRHDRAAVLEALRKGEYEAIATSGQGALEVLRQELARIDLDSLAAFRRRAIQQLFEQDLVRGKTYAQDRTERPLSLGGTHERLQRTRTVGQLAAVGR